MTEEQKTIVCRKIPKTERYDNIVKCILIGDSGVGKTSLMTKLQNEPFRSAMPSTIGIEFGTIFLDLEDQSKKHREKFKVQIWDCAGQVRFRSIVKSYFREAQLVVLMFDITEPESFRGIKEWYHLLQEEIGENTYVQMLIGNKLDLTQPPDYYPTRVDQEDIIAFCEKEKIDNYTTISVKNNSHEEVLNVIYKGIKNIYKLHSQGLIKLTHPYWHDSCVQLDVEKNSKSGCFGCFS